MSKVLFFTLGSPYKRLINYKLGRYDEFLNHDIIFFGPTTEKYFIHNGRSYKIIQLTKEISISTLFELLPGNWMPDVIFVETPVLNYIPDFNKSPVMTICLSRDAWGDMLYNNDIAELFDFVSYQTIDIKKYYQIYSGTLPLYGSAPYSSGINSSNVEYEKRTIDILSISTYNDGMYHKRQQIFAAIALRFGKNYKIRFLNGVKNDQLLYYYKNSKIIIDWSFVNSIRVYDAIQNGCLPISNENNVLISSVLKKDIEYVTYNNDNILDKIEFYLNNVDDAKKIIENAQLRRNEILITPSEKLNKFINYVKVDVLLKDKGDMSDSKVFGAVSTSLYFNYQYPGHNHPFNWKELYFDRINKALSSEEDSIVIIKRLIEAVRFAFLLKNYEKFEIYSSALEKHLPGYPWLLLMKARIAYESKDTTYAEELIKEVHKDFERNKHLIQEFVLPFIERKNAIDARRIVDYMWQFEEKHNNEYQINAFLYEIYILSAKINYANSKKEHAIKDIIVAFNVLVSPAHTYTIYDILIELKEIKVLFDVAEKVLEDSPYHFQSALVYSWAVLSQDLKKRISRKNLLHYFKLLKPFENKAALFSKVFIKKSIIKVLVILHFLVPKELLKRVIYFAFKKSINKL